MLAKHSYFQIQDIEDLWSINGDIDTMLVMYQVGALTLTDVDIQGLMSEAEIVKVVIGQRLEALGMTNTRTPSISINPLD